MCFLGLHPYASNKTLDQRLGASPKTCLFVSFFLIFFPFLHFSCKKLEKAYLDQLLTLLQ